MQNATWNPIHSQLPARNSPHVANKNRNEKKFNQRIIRSHLPQHTCISPICIILYKKWNKVDVVTSDPCEQNIQIAPHISCHKISRIHAWSWPESFGSRTTMRWLLNGIDCNTSSLRWANVCDVGPTQIRRVATWRATYREIIPSLWRHDTVGYSLRAGERD